MALDPVIDSTGKWWEGGRERGGHCSLGPRFSVLDFVSQLWSPKLQDKIRDRKLGVRG